MDSRRAARTVPWLKYFVGLVPFEKKGIYIGGEWYLTYMSVARFDFFQDNMRCTEPLFKNSLREWVEYEADTGGGRTVENWRDQMIVVD